MIAIIDYGMGNLRSVAKALESLGATVKITASPDIIENASGVVLPGVGAMPDAMKALQKAKVISNIKKAIAEDKPFLGICLGLQLLFENSEEGGGCKGLGIFKGSVPKFAFSKLLTSDQRPATALKIPHMGWNQIKIKMADGGPATKASAGRQRTAVKNKGILAGLKDDSYVYFVHSYYVKPKDKNIIATTTNYGFEFCSSIAEGNLFACQFHPEKSQKVGLKILQNFVNMCN
ncbi:MAG: imidazole glycerol phosphate synthase subunit HisH [bacterium]|nr:imidazole glycerol phosphate synthase subunit HisH [bacterium]MDD5354558.1 imidazole glycerol phosphate synthase subunit HisH [bacterium]